MADSKSCLLSSQFLDKHNKKTISDAIHHCLVILRENNEYVSDYTCSDTLSRRSALYGFQMFEFIKSLEKKLASVNSKKFIKLEPVIEQVKDTTLKYTTEQFEEPEKENGIIIKIEPEEEPEDEVVEFEAVEPKKEPEEEKEEDDDEEEEEEESEFDDEEYSESDNEDFSDAVDDSDYANEDDDNNDENNDSKNKKKSSRPRRRIRSLEEKKKIVDLAKKHPNWSIKTINKHSGCRPIKTKKDLSRFVEQVETGGCYTDKWKELNAWVYDKYLEHMKENDNFNERLLRSWGLEARNIFLPEERFGKWFNASRSWMRSFKKAYNLIGLPSSTPIDRESLKTNNYDDEVLSSDSEMKNRKRKRIIKKAIHVPLEVKAKVVKLAKEYPDWTLETLRNKSKCKNIRSRQELDRWAEQVEKGGSLIDKRKKLNDFVYAKCVQNEKNGDGIDNDLLREWALEANKICFPDASYKFSASQEWLYGFKKSYNIIGISPYLKLGKRKRGSQSKNDIEDNESSDDSNNEEEQPSTTKVTKKKKSKSNSDMVVVPRLIRYEDKVKIVKLARDNPTWSIAMLRKATGLRNLRWAKQIDDYEEQIKQGGSRLDKIQDMHDWVFQQCLNYQNSKKGKLTDEKLERFRLKASTIERFRELALKKSHFTWMINFKNKYNITGTPWDLKVPNSLP